MKRLLLRDLQLQAKSVASRPLACYSINYYVLRDNQFRRSFRSSPRVQVVKPYLLADIGEGITECQIINWFVKPGDRVEQFDKICEVQSDKASVEITSRFDGIIKALHYGTDDMAIVGQPLLDIDIEGETIEEEILSEPSESALPETEPANLDQAEDVIKDDILQTAGPREPQMLEEVDGKLRDISPFSAKSPEKHAGLVSPAIRHMLKKLNINATAVKGTGKDGRILKEDVQQHAMAISNAAVSTPANNPTATPTYAVRAQDRVADLTATEKQMFKVMTRSLAIPHFLYTHAVDLTSLNNLRKKFNADPKIGSALSGPGNVVPKLSPLPFIMKALSSAFIQFPRLNSHLDTETNPDKPQLLIKGSHNFGIAVDTPQGLLVPVIRNVQDHSIVSLAAEINRLSSLAKEGRLGVDDFKDATFAISNIGSIGGNAVSPVIVSPMVGIIGVGRVQNVPAFQCDNHGRENIIKRDEVVLSWSADHRVLDGATVAKCAERVKLFLEYFSAIGCMLK